MSIGARLREERERLGLSQDEFAQTGGVQRRAQVRYEQGERQPDAGYLAAIAAAGADALYILTGQRAAPVQEDSKEAGAMTPRDRVWLALGRSLAEADRTRLQEIGDALATARRVTDPCAGGRKK